MNKTSDDYAPCVRIDASGNTRKGNVKAALLLQPDAAGRHWWSAASCMCVWRMRRR